MSNLSVGRDNMRRIGFKFRHGTHAAGNDWPVFCYRGEAEGTYNGRLYTYGEDGKVWLSYPVGLNSKTRNTITYTLDEQAKPTFDDGPRSVKSLSLRTRDRWLSNAWMSTRPASLAAMSIKYRNMEIMWYGEDGEVSVSFLVAEIVALLLDPAEVAGRRKRWRDYLKTPIARKNLKSGRPIGFHDRNLNDDLPMVESVARVERSHIAWLQPQKNGFQHPDPERTVYPSGVKRVALDHRRGISTLRLWGDPPARLNGLELVFTRMAKKGRWEATLSTEEATKIQL